MDNTDFEVKKIISEQLGTGFQEISVETLFFNDLGGDSLDMIELVMSIEETFKIEIKDDEIKNMKTVGDIIQCVKKYKIKL